MKKVININVGRSNFTIEENACQRLQNYLSSFESTISDKNEAMEVMEDIELRVAEIFSETIKYNYQVVDDSLVDKIISMLGTPDGFTNQEKAHTQHTHNNQHMGKPHKRLYRNPDDKTIVGLCGGIAAYFNIDPSLVRVAVVLGVFFGGMSIWIYIILWIAIPEANTITQKLEMRGEAITAENIRNYTKQHRSN